MATHFESVTDQAADESNDGMNRKTSLVHVLESMCPCIHESDSNQIILELLENGADVNARDLNGKTPLILAAGKQGSITMMQILLDHGALLCDQDEEGNTALMEALCKSCSKNVTFLLQHSQHKDLINLTDFEGRSPVSAAVIFGDLNIMIELVDRGADVNLQDIFDDTPLLLALWDSPDDHIGHLPVLLDSGSDVNHQNSCGLSPLMLAASHYTTRSMRFQFPSGACVEVNYQETNFPDLHYGELLSPDVQFLRDEFLIGCDDYSSYDVCQMLLAARPHFEPTLLTLLEAGADVNATSKIDCTKTALSFLPNMTYHGEVTILCMDTFLVRFARLGSVNPVVLQEVIIHGAINDIPKLILCGLLPAEITANKVGLGLNDTDVLTLVSPLCLALLAGNVSLAKYFLDKLFLTSSDLTALASNKTVKNILERKNQQESLGFFKEMAAQPMSLFKHAFVSVSSAVGTSPGRANRVNQLLIPKVLKDDLMFKTYYNERVAQI